MAALTPALIKSRLGLDYRATMRLSAPCLGSVRAFASAADMKAGRDVNRKDGEAGSATHYLVDYTFPILSGPKEKIGRALCAFDLLAGGNYPFTSPVARIATRPLPWNAHFHPGTGIVCIGESWAEARGEMLFPQLVIHIARILNMDERDRGPHYVGWNEPAINYWRTVLHRRPVNPDLVYPVLPAEVTHGMVGEQAFEALADGGEFVPLPFHEGFAPSRDEFAPLEKGRADLGDDFLPLEASR